MLCLFLAFKFLASDVSDQVNYKKEIRRVKFIKCWFHLHETPIHMNLFKIVKIIISILLNTFTKYYAIKYVGIT